LKQKIAENKGGKDFPVDGQKLIYNGKVLEDNKTIGEVNVAAGKFIVVMVVKVWALNFFSKSIGFLEGGSKS